MAIELPSGVAGLFKVLTGMEWPQGNEDTLRHVAQLYTATANDFDQLAELVTELTKSIKENFEGETAEAFIAGMKDLVTGKNYVGSAKDGANELAGFADDIANKIEYMKWMILATLIELAAELLFYAATSWFNWGAPAEAAAAEAAAQITMRIIMKKVLQYLLQHVALGLVTALAMDGIIQYIQIRQHHRAKMDHSLTLQAVEFSVISSVVGGVLGPLTSKFGSLLGKLLGKDFAKDLGKDLANLFDGDFKNLLNNGTKDLANDVGNTLSHNSKGLTNGFDHDLANDVGNDLSHDASSELSHDASSDLGRDTDSKWDGKSDEEPLLGDKNIKDDGEGLGSIEDFSHDMGDVFAKHFGETLGDGAARDLGKEYGETFASAWGRKDLSAVKDDLDHVLSPFADKLGADGVRSLSHDLPDTILKNMIKSTGPDVGRRMADLTAASLSSGVNMTLTTGFYNLIFGPEHTFETGFDSFGGGAAMGALGHGGRMAINHFSPHITKIDPKDFEADFGKGLKLGGADGTHPDDAPGGPGSEPTGTGVKTTGGTGGSGSGSGSGSSRSGSDSGSGSGSSRSGSGSGSGSGSEHTEPNEAPPTSPVRTVSGSGSESSESPRPPAENGPERTGDVGEEPPARVATQSHSDPAGPAPRSGSETERPPAENNTASAGGGSRSVEDRPADTAPPRAVRTTSSSSDPGTGAEGGQDRGPVRETSDTPAATGTAGGSGDHGTPPPSPVRTSGSHHDTPGTPADHQDTRPQDGPGNRPDNAHNDSGRDDSGTPHHGDDRTAPPPADGGNTTGAGRHDVVTDGGHGDHGSHQPVGGGRDFVPAPHWAPHDEARSSDWHDAQRQAADRRDDDLADAAGSFGRERHFEDAFRQWAADRPGMTGDVHDRVHEHALAEQKAFGANDDFLDRSADEVRQSLDRHRTVEETLDHVKDAFAASFLSWSGFTGRLENGGGGHGGDGSAHDHGGREPGPHDLVRDDPAVAGRVHDAAWHEVEHRFRALADRIAPSRLDAPPELITQGADRLMAAAGPGLHDLFTHAARNDARHSAAVDDFDHAVPEAASGANGEPGKLSPGGRDKLLREWEREAAEDHRAAFGDLSGTPGWRKLVGGPRGADRTGTGERDPEHDERTWNDLRAQRLADLPHRVELQLAKEGAARGAVDAVRDSAEGGWRDAAGGLGDRFGEEFDLGARDAGDSAQRDAARSLGGDAHRALDDWSDNGDRDPEDARRITDDAIRPDVVNRRVGIAVARAAAVDRAGFDARQLAAKDAPLAPPDAVDRFVAGHQERVGSLFDATFGDRHAVAGGAHEEGASGSLDDRIPQWREGKGALDGELDHHLRFETSATAGLSHWADRFHDAADEHEISADDLARIGERTREDWFNSFHDHWGPEDLDAGRWLDHEAENGGRFDTDRPHSDDDPGAGPLTVTTRDPGGHGPVRDDHTDPDHDEDRPDDETLVGDDLADRAKDFEDDILKPGSTADDILAQLIGRPSKTAGGKAELFDPESRFPQDISVFTVHTEPTPVHGHGHGHGHGDHGTGEHDGTGDSGTVDHHDGTTDPGSALRDLLRGGGLPDGVADRRVGSFERALDNAGVTDPVVRQAMARVVADHLVPADRVGTVPPDRLDEAVRSLGEIVDTARITDPDVLRQVIEHAHEQAQLIENISRPAVLEAIGEGGHQDLSHYMTESADSVMGNVVRDSLGQMRTRPARPFAVLAVGGYGRRDMTPAADLDFGLIGDHADQAPLNTLRDLVQSNLNLTRGLLPPSAHPDAKAPFEPDVMWLSARGRDGLEVSPDNIAAGLLTDGSGMRQGGVHDSRHVPIDLGYSDEELRAQQDLLDRFGQLRLGMTDPDLERLRLEDAFDSSDAVRPGQVDLKEAVLRTLTVGMQRLNAIREHEAFHPGENPPPHLLGTQERLDALVGSGMLDGDLGRRLGDAFSAGMAIRQRLHREYGGELDKAWMPGGGDPERGLLPLTSQEARDLTDAAAAVHDFQQGGWAWLRGGRIGPITAPRPERPVPTTGQGLSGLFRWGARLGQNRAPAPAPTPRPAVSRPPASRLTAPPAGPPSGHTPSDAASTSRPGPHYPVVDSGTAATWRPRFEAARAAVGTGPEAHGLVQRAATIVSGHHVSPPVFRRDMTPDEQAYASLHENIMQTVAHRIGEHGDDAGRAVSLELRDAFHTARRTGGPAGAPSSHASDPTHADDSEPDQPIASGSGSHDSTVHDPGDRLPGPGRRAQKAPDPQEHVGMHRATRDAERILGSGGDLSHLGHLGDPDTPFADLPHDEQVKRLAQDLLTNRSGSSHDGASASGGHHEDDPVPQPVSTVDERPLPGPGRREFDVPFGEKQRDQLSEAGRAAADDIADQVVRQGVDNRRRGLPLPRLDVVGHGNGQYRRGGEQATRTGATRAATTADGLRERISDGLRALTGDKPKADDFMIGRRSDGADVGPAGADADRTALQDLRRTAVVSVDFQPPQIVLGGAHGDVAVPKKTHFIWLGGKMSDAARHNLKNWLTRTGESGWGVHLWTDQGAREANADFFRGFEEDGGHVEHVTDDLLTGPAPAGGAGGSDRPLRLFDFALGKRAFALASDVVRYGVLYREGGVYLDVDIAPGRIHLPEEPITMARDGVPFFAPAIRDRAHLDRTLKEIDAHIRENQGTVPERDEDDALGDAAEWRYGRGELNNNLIVVPPGTEFMGRVLSNLRDADDPNLLMRDLQNDAAQITGPWFIRNQIERMLQDRGDWPQAPADHGPGRVPYTDAFRDHHVTFDRQQRDLWQDLNLLTAESENREGHTATDDGTPSHDTGSHDSRALSVEQVKDLAAQVRHEVGEEFRVRRDAGVDPDRDDMQWCVALVERFAGRLFPSGFQGDRSGVGAGSHVGDDVVGPDRTADRLAPGGEWSRIGSWEPAARALADRPAGSVVLGLTRSPFGRGHAVLGYRPAGDERPHWVEMSPDDGVVVSTDLPRTPPLEAHAVVIDGRTGRVDPGALTPFHESSSTVHALLDPAADHRRGMFSKFKSRFGRGPAPVPNHLPLVSGNISFTNLSTDARYTDKAVQIASVLAQHEMVGTFLKGRRLDIVLRKVPITGTPAEIQVMDHGTRVEIRLASYYFETYGIGHIMGMMAHELGVHPVGDHYTNPVEEDGLRGIPFNIPGLHGTRQLKVPLETRRHGHDDHLFSTIVAGPRYEAYRDLTMDMASQMHAEGEYQAVTDLVDCFLMDISSIAITNNYRIGAMSGMPNSSRAREEIAAAYNGYKQELVGTRSIPPAVKNLFPPNKNSSDVRADYHRLAMRAASGLVSQPSIATVFHAPMPMPTHAPMPMPMPPHAPMPAPLQDPYGAGPSSRPPSISSHRGSGIYHRDSPPYSHHSPSHRGSGLNTPLYSGSSGGRRQSVSSIRPPMSHHPDPYNAFPTAPQFPMHTPLPRPRRSSFSGPAPSWVPSAPLYSAPPQPRYSAPPPMRVTPTPVYVSAGGRSRRNSFSVPEPFQPPPVSESRRSRPPTRGYVPSAPRSQSASGGIRTRRDDYPGTPAFLDTRPPRSSTFVLPGGATVRSSSRPPSSSRNERPLPPLPPRDPSPPRSHHRHSSSSGKSRRHSSQSRHSGSYGSKSTKYYTSSGY